ncbi:MAG: HD domain-containing protein [Anaerolineae bacterium]
MTIYDQIIDACQPYWRVRSNGIHVPESYAFAQKLLDSYPQANRQIVLPAILLHDNGYARVPEETLLAGLKDAPSGHRPDITRLHEIAGAEIAREILTELAFDDDQIDRIVKIIDGHDSRLESLSIEDSIVKDSDKLWRFTKTGVTIAGIGWMNQTADSFLDYCLSKADGWMFSAEAREIAKITAEETRKTLGRNAL